MDLYNVMVYYKGEGSTNIYLPCAGDTNIISGRPLYLRNCTYSVIEALRQFRDMMIDFKIGAKQDGAYRIIDFEDLDIPIRSPKNKVSSKKEAVSESEISSIISSGQSGPIAIEQSSTINYSEYKLPSGQFEGKTLAEVDKEGKLKAVYNGFKSRNPEVKEAIEKYYDSIIK